MTPRAPLALTAAAAAVLLAGCASGMPEDAPEPGPVPPSLEVLNVSSLSTTITTTFCDHGNRVYRSQNSDLAVALAVVPADPSCAGGAR